MATRRISNEEFTRLAGPPPQTYRLGTMPKPVTMAKPTTKASSIGPCFDKLTPGEQQALTCYVMKMAGGNKARIEKLAAAMIENRTK